jgi:hypothetical protein
MTKKNDIVVAPLPPLAPIVRRQGPSYSVVAPTRAERKSAIEARKQHQVITQQHDLAIAAHTAAAEISESGFSVYTRTTERMYEVAHEPGRDSDLQKQIDKFYEESYKRMGAYIVSINDQGVRNIGETVARGTYTEDTPPQGFLARLRRRDEF